MAWKFGIGTFTILWAVQSAYAGNLSIFGREVTWIDGPQPTYRIVLGVDNTGTQLGLYTWQLECEIIPSSDYVCFSSVMEPSNYVFSEVSHDGLMFFDDPPGTLWVNDAVSVGSAAVPVPSMGANLLQIEVTSSQAAGQYDIRVVVSDESELPDEHSAWYTDTFEPISFDVLAIADRLPDSGIIASVDFGVPEPSTLVLLLLAAIGCALRWGRCPKRTAILGLFRGLPITGWIR